ncbi:hypothetical protein ACQY0O_004286 [Thecaphora frezii]
MAPLPPYLVRIAASILTQALTRKLASSPLFFRLVDRMIHEIDHMPHRLQGRQVPTYQAPLGMREKEWRESSAGIKGNRIPEGSRLTMPLLPPTFPSNDQEEDIGEPHDLPSPFPSSQPPPNGTSDPLRPAPRSFEEIQRMRARQSFAQSQRIAERERRRRQEETKAHESDKASQELRQIQQKLRQLRDEARR